MGLDDSLTLTEPSMTRFVITICQAVNLIESAVNTMEGGEVSFPTSQPARWEDSSPSPLGNP